jgi:hypothetical protein
VLAQWQKVDDLCVPARHIRVRVAIFYHCDMRNLAVQICNVVATPHYSRPQCDTLPPLSRTSQLVAADFSNSPLHR